MSLSASEIAGLPCCPPHVRSNFPDTVRKPKRIRGRLSTNCTRREANLGTNITIIDFVRSHIDKKHSGLLTVFDRLRRKRNLALYDDTGFVSHHDAEQALEAAGNYLNAVRADIAARKP